MSRNSAVSAALALGISLWSACAGATPSIPGPVITLPNYVSNTLTYYAGDDIVASSPSIGTQNLGGTCFTSTCGLPTGDTGGAPYPDTPILVSPLEVPNGYDSNYRLTFQIKDVAIGTNHDTGSTSKSTYAVFVNGLQATLLGSANGTENFSIIIQGAPVGGTPPVDTVDITNLYFDNNVSPVFPISSFTLSVSEGNAPEPASLALLASGAGLIGVVRRRRRTA